MTTGLTTIPKHIPKPTPELAQSLLPQELEDHRAEICSDVEAILDGYWKDRPDLEMKTRILVDWADTLEDWPQGDVLGALRKWRNENPNKKPNPGHILALLKEARGKAEAERMAISKPASQPPRQEITGEEKARRKEFVEQVMSGYREKE